MESPILKYLFVTGILLFASANFSYSMAQHKVSFLQRFGIEIGGGYNQLFWEATDFNGNKVDANRTSFSIMPAARLSYNHNIFKRLNLYSFLGYNEFGGHSKLDNSDTFLNPNVRYQDEFKFRNIETGFLCTYPISNFHIGVGTKVSYHFDIEQRYYYENHPQGQNGWQTNDNPDFFNYWSLDVGLRLEYPIYQNFLLGTEGWFGITDLSKKEFDSVDMFIKQNHFRLLLGYRF